MRKLIAKLGYMLIAPSLNTKAPTIAKGMKLAEHLGKFMEEAMESKQPLMTGITCKMGDSDVIVLRLWASTNGDTPIDRIVQLKARIAELETENEKLKLK